MVWRELVLEGEKKGMKWGTVMGGEFDGAGKSFSYGGQNEDCG
jgi:hypothetical protein